MSSVLESFGPQQALNFLVAVHESPSEFYFWEDLLSIIQLFAIVKQHKFGKLDLT